MRCSCGRPGTIALRRRELPYCEACFHAFIAHAIRLEAGEGPILLQPMEQDKPTTFFPAAVRKACELAKRTVIEDPEGAVPGCQETAAAATLKYVLGREAERTRIFPASITLEELQTFFKGPPPELDSLTRELLTLDAQYPGTTASITKYSER